MAPRAPGFIACVRYLNIGSHKVYWLAYSALIKCRQRFLIRKQTQACLICVCVCFFFFYCLFFFPHRSMKQYSHKWVIFAGAFIRMPGEMTDPICSYWYPSQPITAGNGVSRTGFLSGLTSHPSLLFLAAVTPAWLRMLTRFCRSTEGGQRFYFKQERGFVFCLFYGLIRRGNPSRLPNYFQEASLCKS